jgi:hypothetical protein
MSERKKQRMNGSWYLPSSGLKSHKTIAESYEDMQSTHYRGPCEQKRRRRTREHEI